MIIGDTFYVSDETEDAFRDAGITHLLAVSGTNVTYVILVCMFIFSKLFGKGISNIISIFMIIIFVLVSGASPSVVRAGLMGIIMIFSTLFSKQSNIYTSIALSALLILLYNPFIIFDVGFILSFGGTIGIVVFNPFLTEFFNQKFYFLKDNPIFKTIFETLCTTLSAQIILIPVMWYYFNTISFVSILTNLLVGPFVGIITILGLFLYFVGLISIPIAKFFSYGVYILIELTILIAKFCAGLPMANITVETISSYGIIFYYLFIIRFILLKKIFHKAEHISLINKEGVIDEKTSLIKKFDNKFFLILLKHIIDAFLVLLLLAIIYTRFIPKNFVEINMIDVSQGDSMHIRTEKGYNILIDGGGSEQSSYDIGENILVPYLLDNRASTIDVLFISHFHEDHAEGCVTVLNELKVKKIIIGLQPKSTELYNEVLKIAKEKNIPIITVYKGDTITIDNVMFEVLYPDKELEVQEDLNSNSLALKVNINGVTMLTYGDGEAAEEKEIIKDYSGKLNVDILKVAHHGSKTSSTEELLNEARASLYLISCGVDNKFGHPHDITIDNISKYSDNIFRTDLYGQIKLKIYSDGKISITKKLNL